MPERERDNLDELPSIAPSSEDFRDRQRGGSGSGGGGRRAEGRAGGGASIFTNLLIALLIAGLTACGWFILEQNEALASVGQTLENLDERLLRIEDRLQLTDQALSQAESETQDQLAFWESEIRKLWDVSNKRNRGWIEDNRAAIARLQEGLEGQRQTLESLDATAGRLAEGLEQQEGMMAQLGQIDSRTSEMLSRQRSLADRVNTLTSQQAALDRRLGESEEGVAAMDAFRRDMVGRLSRLQRQVEAMSGDGAGGQTLQPQP